MTSKAEKLAAFKKRAMTGVQLEVLENENKPSETGQIRTVTRNPVKKGAYSGYYCTIANPDGTPVEGLFMGFWPVRPSAVTFPDRDTMRCTLPQRPGKYVTLRILA
jgi:hypothetical protein